RRWLSTGGAGGGAWMTDRPLRVRAESGPGGPVFSVRSPFGSGVPDFVDGWLRRHRLRRFGSTALHLCYVALGGLDFVHDDRASLWDIAGAAPVLLEAGGVLTTEDGAPGFPITAEQAGGEPIALVAGHPASHAEAVRDVRTGRDVAALSAPSRQPPLPFTLAQRRPRRENRRLGVRAGIGRRPPRKGRRPWHAARRRAQRSPVRSPARRSS